MFGHAEFVHRIDDDDAFNDDASWFNVKTSVESFRRRPVDRRNDKIGVLQI